MNTAGRDKANIATVKPDMSVLRGAQLPMSSFGILALAFAQQVAERSRCIAAAHPMFTLEYYDEGENANEAEAPVISPVLKLDFSYILQQMQKLEAEHQGKKSMQTESGSVIYVDKRKTEQNTTVYQTTNIQQTANSGTSVSAAPTGSEPAAQAEGAAVMQSAAPDAQSSSAAAVQQYSEQRNFSNLPVPAAQVLRLVEKAAAMQSSGWGKPSLGVTAMGRDIRVLTKTVRDEPETAAEKLVSEYFSETSRDIFYIENNTVAEGGASPSETAAIPKIEIKVPEKASETSHKDTGGQTAPDADRKVRDTLPAGQEKAERTAAYLPERPEYKRRVTPAGAWKPVDTERGSMTTPQMEMLFSNVIRAEQEMGLTYGSRQSGVPLSPTERTAYLKETTRLIQRREALSEAVYAIPAGALPAEELTFLQEIAERPGTSEQLVTVAEKVVSRVMELTAAPAEAETTQETYTGAVPIRAGAVTGTAAAPVLQSDAQIMAAPTELTYLEQTAGAEAVAPAESARADSSAPEKLSSPAKASAPAERGEQTLEHPADAGRESSPLRESRGRVTERIRSFLRRGGKAPAAAEPTAYPPVELTERVETEQLSGERKPSETVRQSVPTEQSTKTGYRELTLEEQAPPDQSVPTEENITQTESIRTILRENGEQTAPETAAYPPVELTERMAAEPSETEGKTLEGASNTPAAVAHEVQTAPQPQTIRSGVSRHENGANPETAATRNAYPPVELTERRDSGEIPAARTQSTQTRGGSSIPQMQGTQPRGGSRFPLMQDEQLRTGIRLLKWLDGGKEPARAMSAGAVESSIRPVAGQPETAALVPETPMVYGNEAQAPESRNDAAPVKPLVQTAGYGTKSAAGETAVEYRTETEYLRYPETPTAPASAPAQTSAPAETRHAAPVQQTQERQTASKKTRGSRRPWFAFRRNAALAESETRSAEPMTETVYLKQQGIPAGIAAEEYSPRSPIQRASSPGTASPIPRVSVTEEENVYVMPVTAEQSETVRRELIRQESVRERTKTSIVRQPPVTEQVTVEQPPEIRYLDVQGKGITAMPGEMTENAPAAQEPVPQTFLTPQGVESDYVQSLPDWAKDFLKNGYQGDAGEKAPPKEPAGVPAVEQVSWTNPAFDSMRSTSLPPQEISLKQKEEKAPAAAQISEAEIRRTADRVYKIIEDRLRSERRRHGW